MRAMASEVAGVGSEFRILDVPLPVEVGEGRGADTTALFQALGGGWWNRPDPVPTAVEGVIVTEPVQKPDVTK